MALVGVLVEVLAPCRGATFGRGLTSRGITFNRHFALSLGGCGAVLGDDFDDPCSTVLVDGQKKYKYDLKHFTQLPKINSKKNHQQYYVQRNYTKLLIRKRLLLIEIQVIVCKQCRRAYW